MRFGIGRRSALVLSAVAVVGQAAVAPMVAPTIAWLAFAQPAFADPPAASGTPTVRIEAAWIRWLPAGVPAAGYLTLTNTGERPVTLIAAESPSFGDVSIHRSVDRAGTMQMEEVKDITILPHSSVEFAARGYHLMLMQPARSIEPGRQVPITLRFADGSSLTASFDVRKPGGGAGPPPPR